MKQKYKIILASKSPRRFQLLKQAGFEFKIADSKLNEELILKKLKDKRPEELVKVLSLAKALAVLSKISSKQPYKIIAAFDTIVFCKNKIIAKPKNKKDALKKILFLSNKKHCVYTGICLINVKEKTAITDFEKTVVYMKKITKKEAMSYVQSKEPFGKAGAYAIQGKGKKFIEKIKGDYYNVVGLPLKRFKKMIGLALKVGPKG